MAIPGLEDLKQALDGRDTQNMIRRHLAIVADLLRTMASRMDERLDDHDIQLDTIRDLAIQFAQQTDGRLDTLEAVVPVTLTLVANLDALPSSAAPTRFFRVQGDPAVYIGNGAGQSLGKLIPA